MAIEKDDDFGFYATCDHCPHIEGPFETFNSTKLHIRNSEHWHTRRDGDEYTDMCETCWTEYANSLFQRGKKGLQVDFS